MTEQTKTTGKLKEQLPTGRLTAELQNLALALAERGLGSMTGKLESMTGRLTDYAENGGTNLLGAVTGKSASAGPSALTGVKEAAKHTLMSAVTGMAKDTVKGGLKNLVSGIFGGGGKKGKSGDKLKVTNIVETIDIGAPVRLVYNEWTQFQSFPSFMKKVENVEQAADEKLTWKAQVFWSHRTWDSTIMEQIPDQRIVWRSAGAKGYVDGAVTFHALTPDLTRVIVVLEYHPQGLFEKTGNIWRAQGRRARLEIKHFARHVMSECLLHPEEVIEDGWRGEIHDSEVVKDHETALREEQEEKQAEGEYEGEEEEEGAPEEEAEYEGEEEEEGAPEEEAEYEGEEEEGVEEEEPEPEKAEEPKPSRRPFRRRQAAEREEARPTPPVRRRTGARRS
ncbi:SRPBCC family protein [Nonomuraea glycinis]|uniref:SRPBCC family protein n=1 Tax=Nonomuraea glycinis TaxID=2047744 RepID=UPI002E0EDFAB|nr:SRPBCC family protein [Nonomuraea glycinis]